jgi:uncharacterized protein Yka (UPF0111/DUF47 family)
MGFLPRDETFFDFFERMAANLDEAARLLDAFMDDYTDLQAKCACIHDVEHHGDLLTRESIETLNRTFITPFDREEIHELVCRLDDVLDRIDEAANRMVVYRIEKPTADAKALAKVLVNCTGLIKTLMPQLRSLKSPQVIINHCGEIHKQETEGDRVEQHGLAALFESTVDPIYVIKWKDIYKDLEEATDKCADVANVVESIVIRNS